MKVQIGLIGLAMSALFGAQAFSGEVLEVCTGATRKVPNGDFKFRCVGPTATFTLPTLWFTPSTGVTGTKEGSLPGGYTDLTLTFDKGVLKTISPTDTVNGWASIYDGKKKQLAEVYKESTVVNKDVAGVRGVTTHTWKFGVSGYGGPALETNLKSTLIFSNTINVKLDPTGAPQLIDYTASGNWGPTWGPYKRTCSAVK